MGQIKDKLANDIKEAMKARQPEKTAVLRMVLSELKYAQVAGSEHKELDLAAEQKVVQTYYNRLEKSLADYAGSEREAAVKAEMEIVAEYLPKKASPEEVASVIKQVLQKNEQHQFGPLMKEVMSELGSAADGKLVSKMLKNALTP